MVDIKQVADEAEVIIDGYAFSKFEGGYRVLNLNAPDKAAVFAAISLNGLISIELTFSDVEGKGRYNKKDCIHISVD